MFKQKNALIAVAVAVLLAACGGGGGGDDNTSPATGSDQNTNPGGGNPSVVVVPDDKVEGHMLLDQVAVNGNYFSLQDFQGTTGIYAQNRGTVAPLQTFGLQLTQNENPTTGASGNGHVGVELIDTAAGAPTQVQFIIDRVDYNIDPSNAWTVAVPASAKMYVHVKNSAGGVADLTVSELPADLVTVANFGPADPGARVLTVDIDKALVTARDKGTDAQKAVLESLREFKGTFNMNVSYSALDIRFGTTPTALQGADITVAGQTVKGSVDGSGVQGKYSVEFDPTAPVTP